MGFNKMMPNIMNRVSHSSSPPSSRERHTESNHSALVGYRIIRGTFKRDSFPKGLPPPVSDGEGQCVNTAYSNSAQSIGSNTTTLEKTMPLVVSRITQLKAQTTVNTVLSLHILLEVKAFTAEVSLETD